MSSAVPLWLWLRLWLLAACWFCGAVGISLCFGWLCVGDSFDGDLFGLGATAGEGLLMEAVRRTGGGGLELFMELRLPTGPALVIGMPARGKQQSQYTTSKQWLNTHNTMKGPDMYTLYFKLKSSQCLIYQHSEKSSNDKQIIYNCQIYKTIKAPVQDASYNTLCRLIRHSYESLIKREIVCMT